MKFVYVALNWAFGVLFLLTGLLSFIELPLAGLLLVTISLLLLPPIRRLVYSRTNRKLPFKVRGLAILLLFVAFGVLVVLSQFRKDRELSAMKAREMARRAYAQSQQDHSQFFGVDAWDHADYVEKNGVGLCVICHSLETSDPNVISRGPRCLSCHGVVWEDEDSRGDFS